MLFNRARAVCLSTAAAVALLVVSASSQTLGEPENFSASAIDLNTSRTGQIEISVNRWSMPSERNTLTDTLFEKGSQALLDKLRDMKPIGRIHTAGSIGYELRYAEQRRLPEGDREIILATDRPMSFWEMTSGSRTTQYPFTWIQLRIKPDGTGTGSLAVAAKIIGDADDRSIEVEDYALYPVRLENVRATKSPRRSN